MTKNIYCYSLIPKQIKYIFFNFCYRTESISRGFTILLLAESEDHSKVLETLDKAVLLLGNHLKIAQILVWRPGVTELEQKVLSSSVQVCFMCSYQIALSLRVL